MVQMITCLNNQLRLSAEKIPQQVDNKHCFREPRELFNVVLPLLKNFFLRPSSPNRIIYCFA